LTPNGIHTLNPFVLWSKDTTQSKLIRRARRNRDGSRGRSLCPFNCRLADVCEVHYLTTRMKDFAFWIFRTLLFVYVCVSLSEVIGMSLDNPMWIWYFCLLMDYRNNLSFKPFLVMMIFVIPNFYESPSFWTNFSICLSAVSFSFVTDSVLDSLKERKIDCSSVSVEEKSYFIFKMNNPSATFDQYLSRLDDISSQEPVS